MGGAQKQLCDICLWQEWSNNYAVDTDIPVVLEAMAGTFFPFLSSSVCRQECHSQQWGEGEGFRNFPS